MDSIKYARIVGYLQCCSDILSMKSVPSCTTISFNKIGDSKNMLQTFKAYFISLWKEYGIPECYESYEDLVDKFVLRFVKLQGWQLRLISDLDYWIYPMFDNSKIIDESITYKIKYIIDSITALIEDYFCGTEVEVYTFGKEDEEFLKNNLDCIKNEDYIFKTENEIYMLHLGVSD